MSFSNPSIVIGVDAVDRAKDVLAGVDSKVRQTTTNIEQEGNKINSKMSQISANFRANMAGIATTAAGLSAGIVGFATSFDTLEKAQLSADRAQLTYSKSLETLRDLQTSGKASAEELANAQEQVRVNSERARLAQDAMNDTYVNFLANVPSQMMSFGVAANSIFTMLRVHHVTGGAAAAAHSVVYSGALANMGAANARFAGSLALVRGALTFLATHPILLVFMAFATLITLVATNTFGLRDAFFSLGKAIYEFFVQYFKPLADAMKWFYDNVLKPIGEFMGGTGTQNAYAYSESMDSIAVTTAAAKQEVQSLEGYLEELAVQTQETKLENLYYLESIGKLGLAVGITNDRLEIMADYLRDVSREEKQTLQENFELVADIVGLERAMSMSNIQINQMASNLRDLQEATKEATSATRELNSEQEKTRSFDDERGVTYESGKFRATGELAEAREKYPGMDLLKIGSNYLPKNLTVAKRALESAQSRLANYERRADDNGLTRSELDRLGELRANVETARNRYAEEMINVQIIINKNDAYVEVRDTQNRLLKSSRQVLLGAGLD